MSYAVDVSALITQLKAAPQQAQVERPEDLSPYLEAELLPLLQAEVAVALSTIQFDEFEADDLPTLFGYLEEQQRASYQIQNLAQFFCKAAPLVTQTRSFL